MPRDAKQPTELHPTEKCPCGSRKTYGRCCKKRDFKWERRADGEILRSAPISAELMEQLKETKADFVETFGRQPRKNDPVFFEQFYTSDEDLRRGTLKAMKAAKSPPSLVYAYRKTGRMVTTRNKNMLTPDELLEWQEAIDEYYDSVESGNDIDVFEDNNGLSSFLLDSIRRNQIVGGSFITRHFNNYRNRKGSVADIESIVAFATTNFVRTLKSIHILIDQNVAYDAYHLIRSLYENYLTVKYTYENPMEVKVFLAQLGTILGTHELARNKRGTPIQSEIVELTTGDRISVPSRWTMASTLGDFDTALYDTLYRTLSSYSHSEITNIPHFISDMGFDYLNNDFTFDVLANCHLVCML